MLTMRVSSLGLLFSSVLAVSMVKADIVRDTKQYADHCIKAVPYNGLRACFYIPTGILSQFQQIQGIEGFSTEEGKCK